MDFIYITKLISQLSFLYVIFGYMASLYKLQENLYLPYAAFVVIGYMCYKLRQLAKKRWVSFVPMALIVPCVLLPVLDNPYASLIISKLICLLPPAAYIVIIGVKDDYTPNYYAYYEFLKKSVIIALTMCVVSALLPALQHPKATTYSMTVIHIVTGVVMLRTLRQDRSIYSTPRYQITNLAVIIAVAVVCLALSSDFVVHTVIIGSIKFVLTSIAKLYNSVMKALEGALVPVTPTPEPHITPTPDMTWSGELVTPSPTPSPTIAPELVITPGNAQSVPEWVIFLILFAVMAAVFIMIMRAVGISKKRKSDWQEVEDDDKITERHEKRRSLFARLSAAEKVREIFKGFIRRMRRSGMNDTASTTSEDVCVFGIAAHEYDPKLVEQLREIYIRARYSSEDITNDDVKRARKIASQLKKS